jgi:serine/threonine protein kinase
MAPELVQHGTKASAKADVYSLGVLAWELLARRRPSLRPAVSVVLAGEIPYPPPSLALEALGLSPTVTGAIDACLALDPSLRPDAHTLEQIFAAACGDYA